MTARQLLLAIRSSRSAAATAVSIATAASAAKAASTATPFSTVAAVFAVAAATVLAAAPGDPFPLGPFSGSADSLLVSAVDADVVLVGKNPEGLFRSTNGGVTFTSIGAGLPAGAYLSDLTRDPQDDPRDGERIFGLYNKRVWVSEDFGASWTDFDFVAPTPLASMAVPTSGETLLTASTSAVFRSATGGTHWTTVATGMDIRALVFAPSDSSLAYHGSNDGVFKSVNNGASFTDPGPFSADTQALAVNPADADQVFAGTDDGVHRSDDGGLTFAPASTGLPADADARLFGWSPDGARLWVGLADGVFAGGMWFSDDFGASWNDGNAGFAPLAPPLPTELSFATGGDIFVGGQGTGGLWRTFGPALPWIHIGFPEGNVWDTLIAGPGGTRVGSSAKGVYAAPAGAGELKPTAWQAATGKQIEALAADPADSDRWLAGGYGPAIDTAQVVVLTVGGTVAEQTYARTATGRVSSFSFDPFAPGVVLGSIRAWDFGDPGMIRSTDSGASWTEVPGTEGWATRTVAHDAFTPGRALAYLADARWAETTNGGLTWTLHGAWVPSSFHGVFLATDPWQPLRLWRGDASGAVAGALYRSDDGGASWEDLGHEMHDGAEIQRHPDIPDLIWVGDNASRLWISGDAGTTWELAFTSWPGADVGSLALDSSDGTLLVGTSNWSAWELPGASPYVRLGTGTPGTGGFVPRHYAFGGLPQPGNAGWTLAADRMLGGTTAFLIIGVVEGALPFVGGSLFVAPPWLLALPLPTGGMPGVGGSATLDVTLALPADPILVGATILSQLVVNDAGGPGGYSRVLTNGLRTTFMP